MHMYPGMQKFVAQVSFLNHVNLSCLMIYYILVSHGAVQCMLLDWHSSSTDLHKLLQASHNIFVAAAFVKLLISLFSAYIYLFFPQTTCITLAYFI